MYTFLPGRPPRYTLHTMSAIPNNISLYCRSIYRFSAIQFSPFSAILIWKFVENQLVIMVSSSISRLLTRSSVCRLKNTSFAQARAGIIGTASQDQRIFRREYIAGNPPPGTSSRIIIEAEFDDQPESRDLGMPAPEPATVGAVLEAVADNIPEKLVEQSDISATQSAESRMMGQQVPGGPASTMQSALDNSTVLAPPTIGETLVDASERLVTDKVVTQADARRVKIVESRNDPLGRLQEGGIGDTMQDAADFNEAQGFTGNAQVWVTSYILYKKKTLQQ